MSIQRKTRKGNRVVYETYSNISGTNTYIGSYTTQTKAEEAKTIFEQTGEKIQSDFTRNTSLPKYIQKVKNVYLINYWDEVDKKRVYVTCRDNLVDAIKTRDAFIKEYKANSGVVDISKYRNKQLPKGISVVKNKKSTKYKAALNISHNGKALPNIHIGTYDTVDEAVNARIDYINKLL